MLSSIELGEGWDREGAGGNGRYRKVNLSMGLMRTRTLCRRSQRLEEGEKRGRWTLLSLKGIEHFPITVHLRSSIWSVSETCMQVFFTSFHVI